MNFPKFWALGNFQGYSCWRWSFQSLADAQASANEAARKLAGRFRAGDYPPKHGYYPDRPFREEVLQEINDAKGLAAVITRNSYGCKVLNTERVMFVDIDLPEPQKPKRGLFQMLFGKPTPPPPRIPARKTKRSSGWRNGHAIITNRVGGPTGPARACVCWLLKAWSKRTPKWRRIFFRRWARTRSIESFVRHKNVIGRG